MRIVNLVFFIAVLVCTACNKDDEAVVNDALKISFDAFMRSLLTLTLF